VTVPSDRKERKAVSDFAKQIEREGWPDWGVRCKHGVQGGLHCEWCGPVDALPVSEKLSGRPR
jgi:hypothetical protein